jgi:DNA repair photolyase
MRIYAGLQPEDWRRWGQYTTFKSNAAMHIVREVRGEEVVYCSPLVDPYQPAEEQRLLMPDILAALADHPPRLFTVQTRSPLIVRDLPLLARLAAVTDVRVSFSLTTDREDVRRLYEPHCAPLEERLQTMRALRAAGIRTFATLAPLLPCDPETLASKAIETTSENLIGDPFHVRSVKRHGATTRPQAEAVSRHHGWQAWHEPRHHAEIVARIRAVAEAAGRRFGIGPEGFRWLAQ